MAKALTAGLTGQTGAGKSTAALTFKSSGYYIIDADKAAREVTVKGSPVLTSLAKAFGEDIIKEDGTLDRALLAQRAFSDKQHTDLLNSITHPAIAGRIEKLRNEAFASGYDSILIDAPLLFDAGLDSLCDVTVAVTAPVEKREYRIIKRDGLSADEARSRMDAQKDEQYYISHASYVIMNDEDTQTLRERTRETIIKIEENAEKNV